MGRKENPVNNTCPLCPNKAEGKAVRGINFCRVHRELALRVRDNPDFKKYEVQFGIDRGKEFADTVRGTQKEIDRLSATS